MMRENKVLICVLGQVRAAQLTYASFEEKCLKKLNADLALCIGEDKTLNTDLNPYILNAKYKWFQKEYEDYGEGIDSLLRSAKISNDENWRQLIKIKDQWLGGVKGENQHSGSGGIQLYFREALLQHLEHNNLCNQYDWIIITRSDFIWQLDHPELKSLSKKRIYIPFGEQYGGYTDRHAIIPSNFVKTYLSVLREVCFDINKTIDELTCENHWNWNIERIIYYHIKKTKVSVGYVPYIMYSVRCEQTPTRWSKGIYNKEKNIYIKYPSEKERSDRLLNIYNKFPFLYKIFANSSLFLFLIGSRKMAFIAHFIFYKLKKNKIIAKVFLAKKNTSEFYRLIIYELKKLSTFFRR
jgi:hypothetical protein